MSSTIKHYKGSFNREHYENDTELSKECWTIKRNHFTPIVIWRIIKKCAPFNTTKRKCYLCLNEKLEIASYKGDNLLNKRSELINKCRHQNKFTLLRHDRKDEELCFCCDICRCIPIGACVFGLRGLCFALCFSQQNGAAQIDSFIGEYCREYSL